MDNSLIFPPPAVIDTYDIVSGLELHYISRIMMAGIIVLSFVLFDMFLRHPTSKAMQIADKNGLDIIAFGGEKDYINIVGNILQTMALFASMFLVAIAMIYYSGVRGI